MDAVQNELIRRLKMLNGEMRRQFDPEKLVEMYRLIDQLHVEKPEPSYVPAESRQLFRKF
jgi:hypothetical protein